MSSILAALRRTARPAVVLVTALSAFTAAAVAWADGIDVSHWQGTVSWSRVHSDGVTFAFMKATEGDYYTDPTLRTNWEGAEAQGIYRGAYHFARPSVGSAREQARYFVSKAGTFQDRGDLPPVLDLEATGGLSDSELATWVSRWLRTVESLTGRTPIVYTSPYFWIDNVGNSRDFTHYPLWIAHYTSGRPLVPGGWSTWTFWQHTSSGSVSGISGHVDMNEFNGSNRALARIANSRGGSDAPAPSGPTLPVGAATVISLVPGTTASSAGATVSFTGALRTANPVTAVPRRRVSLWARPVGSETWTRVAVGRTSDDGSYAVSAVPSQSADYQMRRVSSGTAYASSASPLVRVTVAGSTSVDLLKDHTTVRKGADLMLYGHVTADGDGVAGSTVNYYKRFVHGGTWVYVGSSHSAAPTGWHSIVVNPLVPRVWKAVTVASPGHPSATSSYLTVTPR